MARETKEVVERVLSSLPADYERVLRLVHLEGQDLAAASVALGRSRDAVRMLYGRAIERFSSSLRCAQKREEP